MESFFDKIVGHMQSHGEERAREQQTPQQGMQTSLAARVPSMKKQARANIDDDIPTETAACEAREPQAAPRPAANPAMPALFPS